MHSIMFKLHHLPFSSKIFKMAGVAILDCQRNDLSNSESLRCSDASHQILAKSNLHVGRRCHLKNFKMATMVVILDIRMEQF